MSRKQLMQYVPIALAVVVMLYTCWKQGVWSERWWISPELELFSKQLEHVPVSFGEWEGVDLKTDERMLKIVGAEGEMTRRYKNASGEQVAVSIIVARYQDIFQHTPDRCYPAAGFEMQGEPVRETFEIGDTPAEFFTCSFLKAEPSGVHKERGYWSWSGDGTWKAPKNAKTEFGGQQWALYKMYVFSSSEGDRRTEDHDFCKQFIHDFVPVLHAALRPVLVETGRIKSETPGEESQSPEPEAQASR